MSEVTDALTRKKTKMKATFTVTLPAGASFTDDDSQMLETFLEFLAQQSYDKRDSVGDDVEFTEADCEAMEQSASVSFS